MTLLERLPIEKFLLQRGIDFRVVGHVHADTARTEAAALNMSADHVLKVVVLRVDEGFVLAVVPASRRLDMRRVARSMPGAHARLATEAEIERRFPGFELGALPALPGLLGVPALVDPEVLERDEVAFADGKQDASVVASPGELFGGQDVTVAPITDGYGASGAWRFDGDGVDVADRAQHLDDDR